MNHLIPDEGIAFEIFFLSFVHAIQYTHLSTFVNLPILQQNGLKKARTEGRLTSEILVPQPQPFHRSAFAPGIYDCTITLGAYTQTSNEDRRMNSRVIKWKIEEVPHFCEFTKNDFMSECPGMATLQHDPFPDKKPDDIVRREEIARKLVVHAKITGDVIDLRPGIRVRIDEQDFAVTSAKIAINTESEEKSTAEIEGEHFLNQPEPMKLLAKLRNQEEIYRDDVSQPALIKDISEGFKKYLAAHPEKLYVLTPRKFEELIAEILRDFGFSTELTPMTRDGGRDIYAYVRNAVTEFLMFVECKRWSAHKKVGIEIVQRVHGAAKAGGAHKAMIITTSFFTLPAQRERSKIDTELELKDYDDLKSWLSKYK